jgi:hypothetical protein
MGPAIQKPGFLSKKKPHIDNQSIWGSVFILTKQHVQSSPTAQAQKDYSVQAGFLTPGSVYLLRLPVPFGQ